MSRCVHCGKEITLKEGEKNCPNPDCGLPPYNCWNCHIDITGETKQCGWCGYFKCPECNSCHPSCSSFTHLANIKGMTLRQIVDYFEKVKISFDKKNCPFGVPISYAKGKIRNYLLKLKGHHVKNKEDQEIFNKRFDEKIINMPIDNSFTITNLREMGFHGIEIREVCNLGICLGFINHERKVDEKTQREYDLYTRINGRQCEYFDDKNLITKKCPICKKTYSVKDTICENNKCKYKKGKRKGEYRQLVERISTVDICQLDRGKFIKKEEKNGI